jgi:type IV pilus assembly protein PilM
MFGFFEKTGGPVLGVDIGTTAIKLTEVRRGKKLPELINYGVLESEDAFLRGHTGFQVSSLKFLEEQAVDFLKMLLERVKPQTKVALASLPVFSAFTTILSFPDMSPADIEKSIGYQAKQYIPIPISEAALDWMKVGEFEDDKGAKNIQVLLISVPKETIKKYQDIFSGAGLALKALEVETLSLTRALTQGDPTPSFILDIGSRVSSILIAANGQILFSGETDFGGASLTQGLASSLNISPTRAEELKKERGIVNTGPNQELSTIMLPFLSAIINEVKKVEFAYRGRFPNAPKIERLILSGGGSNLLGIQKFFSDEMGIPVVKASPFLRFEHSPLIEPLIPELNPKFSVALGLPLREF